MNKLFVQFVDDGILCRKRKYIFQNGLSTANCEGEMIWIEPEEQIPDFKGTLYVSAWYKQDVIKTYEFANNNPESKVVIGGPVASQLNIPKYNLPNVTVTKESAESFFGEEKWHLKIPEKYNDSHISWTYLVDDASICYWGKCTFCRSSDFKRILSSRNIDHIPIIEIGKTKSIWLGSLCLFPVSLYKIFSVAPNREDVFYFSYIRATQKTADCVKLALKPNAGKQCVFVCGLEFPGNRMLKWMKKGMTTEEQLYTIKTLTDLGCEINLNFIVDWIEIKESDLKEAENFFKQLKQIHKNNLSAKVYEFHIVSSAMMNIREKLLVKNSLGDLVNYIPVLTEEEKRLNKRLREIYYNFPWLHVDESSLKK